MKKLVLGTVLAVVSVPAFATKARLIALGENVQDNIGSLYFSDSRNIFQNAAYANDYKNMFITEWGSQGGTATSKGDTDTAPQAEGGVLKEIGGYVYGLYLGAESPYTNEVRQYTRLGGNANFQQDNQIDVFFAGQGSVKWGLNATYSATKNNTATSGARQSSASIRGGFIADKLEGFLNVALMNRARITASNGGTNIAGEDKFNGKRGFEAGATYNLEVVKVFGYVRHAEWSHDADSTTALTAYQGKFDGTYWLYQAGAGKEHKLTDKTTLFAKLEYLSFNRSVDAKSGGANGKTITLDDWRAPLTIGLEHDTASWLTLRGSISQNILGQTDNNYKGQDALIAAGVKNLRPSGKRSTANSTNVNAGATLKFGDLSFDGLIGTGNDGTNTITDTKSEKGILSLDNLMTRVAMTYKF